MSMTARLDTNTNPGVFQRLLKGLREGTTYRTPPGQSGAEHLVATLVHRTIVSLTIQGVLVAAIAPLITVRLVVLAGIYLMLAGVGHLVNRRYGPRAAWRTGYILATLGIAPWIAVGGGIYSHTVAAVVMLTINSSVVFELNTTLLTLACQAVLLGAMSALQAHGFWFQRRISPAPGVMWMLITQMTVNFAIPIVTTIQAYREALGRLEDKVDHLTIAEEDTRKLLSAQSRLFYDISHELRSPLTRLNLSVGKVRREVPPRAEASLARMESEVDRLNRLIHQLLLLAQLQQGAAFPMDQHFDLATELASVCQDAEFEANVAGRDLRLVIDQSARAGCGLEGCAELVRSAIDNVVRNAIRFAPEGSEVEVRLVRSDARFASIEVSDRGPGVPESQLPMLFDPFFRVISDGVPALRQSGSGLGLAIAHEAIQKHGGHVFASNRAGGGFMVRLEIPVKPITIMNSTAAYAHAAAR